MYVLALWPGWSRTIGLQGLKVQSQGPAAQAFVESNLKALFRQDSHGFFEGALFGSFATLPPHRNLIDKISGAQGRIPR